MTWQIQQLTGIGGLTSGAPAALGTLSVTSYGAQLHACYADAAGLLRDAWFDPSSAGWNAQQLTGSAGVTAGPVAAGGPAVATYGRQLHVAYVDSSGLVRDAFYDADANTWNLQQLTGAGGLAGGPTAAAGSLFLATFVAELHAVYVDASGILRDAWYDGISGRWNLQQPNGAGGLTTSPAAAGRPFVVTYGDQYHVSYVDRSGSIRDTWYDGRSRSWNAQQVTGSGGLVSTPTAVAASLCGALYAGQMHLGYVSPTGLVIDVWYDGASGKWNGQQLNGPGGLTNAPAAVAGTLSMASYGNELHASFVDAGGSLWDARYDSTSARWRLLRLLGPGGLTDGPLAQAGNVNLADYGAQLHTCYADAAGSVWDAWFPGGQPTA